MSEPAIRHMTIGEFLDWEDGTDIRYELIGGCAVAMAPPAPAHSRLAGRLGGSIDAALRSRRHCGMHPEAGIARPDRNDTCYIADIAVTCDPLRRGDRVIPNPILIVEVLSPSTAVFDRQAKVADYRRIPSVQELLLIDSESIFAEVLRRDGDRWITELVQGPASVLALGSIPLTVAMSELYQGIPLPEPRSRPGAAG
jgi:Uma2 family endonuclease